MTVAAILKFHAERDNLPAFWETWECPLANVSVARGGRLVKWSTLGAASPGYPKVSAIIGCSERAVQGAHAACAVFWASKSSGLTIPRVEWIRSLLNQRIYAVIARITCLRVAQRSRR